MRQRQVIESIDHKAMSVNTISNYRKLVDVFNKYVKTNLTFNDMLSLALNYCGCMKNMKSSYIQGHDVWIDGASIKVASNMELQKNYDRNRNNIYIYI